MFQPNKIKSIMLVLVFIFSAFLNVSAQENTFDEQQLQMLAKSARQKLEGKTYRSTVINVEYENGNSFPARSGKTIVEIIPPDRRHFLSETQTAEGVKRYEYIRVGDKEFAKNDNGEWKELGGYGTGIGTGGGSGFGYGSDVKIERTVERKLKKGETVNNQSADLYETVDTTKYIYPTATYANVSKESYWFDASGRFVKTANEDENGMAKTTSRTTTEYEYDANIKIEAPSIKKQAK